jgi:peptide/nickel transport system substrate-binding protein
MKIGAWRAAVAASAALAVVVAGCGSSSNENSSSTPKAGSNTSSSGSSAKKGGDLKVLYAADVDFMDPRQTYYQYGFLVAYATQRPLYSYKPDDAKTLEPDLAEGPPDISSDGKTVTVKIRTGVKFSPPVNREVTSKDVKYALESAFTKTVNGPYVGAYMGDLHGLQDFKDGKAKEITGIQTPDDQTIVFKLDRPRGAIVAGMLSMPASAPVPEEYAKKFDAQNPTTYGQHAVATGPYMVQNDAQGNLTGWKPNQFIKLVRNPNWDAKTDYKPAYLDSITIQEGVDPQVASRQILSGQGMASGDFQIPAETLAQTSRNAAQKAQLVLTPPTGRYRYISLNTRVKPFDNVNVRKAISAAFDRNALRQAFGGPLTGDIPTHWIPPGQPGFDEAGGTQGPGDDFMSKPGGDMALAAEYMKKAGYPSGKYTGGGTFSAVSDSATQQKNVAEVAQQQFAKLGFNVKTRYVVRNTMYTKFCQVPKNEPDICPSVGWLKDFADPEAILGPVFNGKNILPQSNSNFSLLDDKALNAQMDKAEVVNDPAQRNQAWGDVDKTVTGLAPGVAWLWDKQPMLESKNVNGVVNVANASWDLTFSSLK